jgi:hypothetical protein
MVEAATKSLCILATATEKSHQWRCDLGCCIITKAARSGPVRCTITGSSKAKCLGQPCPRTDEHHFHSQNALGVICLAILDVMFFD